MDEARLHAAIKELLKQPVAYHRTLAKIGGGATAGLMLSQAWYWTNRVDGEGWFYKSQEEWEEETGLTRTEQETARRNLREKGLLEEKRAGMPARLYFRVNVKRLFALIAEKPQTRLRETRKQERAQAADMIAEKPQTTNKDTETTAENTAEKEIGSVQERADILLADYFKTVGRDPAKVHVDTQRAWLELIAHRLRQGWSDEQVRQVWLGCTRDNWPDRPKFNAVSDLLATPKRIDHFINLATLQAGDTTNGNRRKSLNGRPDANSHGLPRPDTGNDREWAVKNRV